MKFHMSRAMNYDGTPLWYWNGVRVKAVWYTTGRTNGREFTKRLIIAD